MDQSPRQLAWATERDNKGYHSTTRVPLYQRSRSGYEKRKRSVPLKALSKGKAARKFRRGRAQRHSPSQEVVRLRMEHPDGHEPGVVPPVAEQELSGGRGPAVPPVQRQDKPRVEELGGCLVAAEEVGEGGEEEGRVDDKGEEEEEGGSHAVEGDEGAEDAVDALLPLLPHLALEGEDEPVGRPHVEETQSHDLRGKHCAR